LDTRGPEIDIANAVNIRNVFRNARSVRVIVLMNYQGLCSARCHTLKVMLDNCRELFTNESNLLKEKESILIGISRNGDEDLGNLQSYLCEGDDTPDIMKEFRNRLFFFDPLDGKGPHYKLLGGGWKRYEILSELQRLKLIKNPDGIFQTNLSEGNVLKLNDFVDEMTSRCIDALENPTTGVTKDRKMKEATEMYSAFETLAEGINHRRVHKMYNDLRKKIRTYYLNICNEVRLKCRECIGNDISEDAIKKSVQEARDLVLVLQKGLDNFQFLEEVIDLEALDEEILEHQTALATSISKDDAIKKAKQEIVDLKAELDVLQPKEKQIPNLGIVPTSNESIGDERYVYIKSIRGYWLSAAKWSTCLAASANEADRTRFKMVTRTYLGKKVVHLSIADHADHPYMKRNTCVYSSGWTKYAKFTCASSDCDQLWTTSDGTYEGGPIDDCDYKLETECRFRSCSSFRYMAVNSYNRVSTSYDDEAKVWVEVRKIEDLSMPVRRLLGLLTSTGYCSKFTIHACEEDPLAF